MPNIKYVYEIKSRDFMSAGDASAYIKSVLKKLGLDHEIIRRVAVAAYEAELNIAIHSVGGVLTVEITPDYIDIIGEDRGPGIEDIALAMQEGFSTAPEEIREMGFGAGMGLPNMKKCSDEFRIHSELGKGTKIFMRIYIGGGSNEQ